MKILEENLKIWKICKQKTQQIHVTFDGYFDLCWNGFSNNSYYLRKVSILLSWKFLIISKDIL